MQPTLLCKTTALQGPTRPTLPLVRSSVARTCPSPDRPWDGDQGPDALADLAGQPRHLALLCALPWGSGTNDCRTGCYGGGGARSCGICSGQWCFVSFMMDLTALLTIAPEPLARMVGVDDGCYLEGCWPLPLSPHCLENTASPYQSRIRSGCLRLMYGIGRHKLGVPYMLLPTTASVTSSHF